MPSLGLPPLFPDGNNEVERQHEVENVMHTPEESTKEIEEQGGDHARSLQQRDLSAEAPPVREAVRNDMQESDARRDAFGADQESLKRKGKDKPKRKKKRKSQNKVDDEKAPLVREAVRNALLESDARRDAFGADQESLKRKGVEKSKRKKKRKGQKKVDDEKRGPSNLEQQDETASMGLGEVVDVDKGAAVVRSEESGIPLESEEERKLCKQIESQNEHSEAGYTVVESKRKKRMTQQSIQSSEDGKEVIDANRIFTVRECFGHHKTEHIKRKCNDNIKKFLRNELQQRNSRPIDKMYLLGHHFSTLVGILSTSRSRLTTSYADPEWRQKKGFRKFDNYSSDDHYNEYKYWQDMLGHSSRAKYFLGILEAAATKWDSKLGPQYFQWCMVVAKGHEIAHPDVIALVDYLHQEAELDPLVSNGVNLKDIFLMFLSGFDTFKKEGINQKT